MSQIYKALSSSGPLPPTIPTSFVTDVNSPAVPAANILDVVGGFTSTNNLNGIQTDGSSGGNVLTIQLTNTVQGFIGTNDATPATIMSFALGATPGTYVFEGNIEAYDVTDSQSAAFGFRVGVRTTGAAGLIIGTDFADSFFEPLTSALTFSVAVSINSFIVQVIGKAATNIDWRGIMVYRFVS